MIDNPIKLQRDGKMYYFRSINALYGTFNKDDPWNRANELRMMQHADIVIDLKTNEILKCRYHLIDVFDKMMNIEG